MLNEDVSKYRKKIITIPNMISLFRLCLIPVIIWLYCIEENYIGALLVVVVSGISDLLDGMIARKFHMISDLGKALDPVADKLTQIAVLFCLTARFPLIRIPAVILVVKEILAAILNMLVIKKTGQVTGAVWHGKLCTAFLYFTMMIHLAWIQIPPVFSDVLSGLCSIMLLFSACMYICHNMKELKSGKSIL